MKNNYKTIYADIRGRIESREFAPGILLPTESEMASEWNVSRPTITKVYNQLQTEGLVFKRKGYGTEVIDRKDVEVPLYGLLLPGAGESEIFSIINDKLLEMSSPDSYECLCEGTSASNARIRSEFLRSCTEEYIRKKVDGIIFSPLERVDHADELNDEVCNMIDEVGIPMVLIDRDICNFPQRSKYDLVCIDNYSAGFQMATHLIGQGCRRIVFFCRPLSAYSVQLRISGVAAALRQAGLPFGCDDVICAETSDSKAIEKFGFEKGIGIICANDSTAAMLMPELEALGYGIGKDLYVCGFDDMKYARHLKFPLTTYRQPCVQIAEVAVELLQRRISDPYAPRVTANLDGELIARDSSAVK